jgi:hypothetical protein
VNPGAPEGTAVPASGSRRVNIVTNPMISHILWHLPIVFIPRCFLPCKRIRRFMTMILKQTHA